MGLGAQGRVLPGEVGGYETEMEEGEGAKLGSEVVVRREEPAEEGVELVLSKPGTPLKVSPTQPCAAARSLMSSTHRVSRRALSAWAWVIIRAFSST